MHELLPFVLPFIGGAAVWSTRDPTTLLKTLLILVSGPAVRRRGLPRWVAYVVPMTLTFLAGVPKLDLYGLILFGVLAVYFDGATERAFVSGIALMIIAGLAPPERTGYTICSILFCVVLFVFLMLREWARLDRLGERPIRERSDLYRLVFLALLAAAHALGAAFVLPPTQGWLIDSQVFPVSRISGFSPVADLRAISSIKTSQRVALRVFNGRPRLLRGQVYATYRKGRWLAARPAPIVTVHGALDGPPEIRGLPERVESEMSSSLVVFAPLSTAAVHAPGCMVERNRSGLYRVVAGSLDGWSYWPGGSEAATVVSSPATEFLEWPPEMSAQVRELALSWTAGRTDPKGRVQAIVDRLGREYRYSLEPGDDGGRDPLERFLFSSRLGHCELFASAMVVLCRAARVEARYVVGYSMSEWNPFGGYMVARDADAHAWVEVRIPNEGWVTYDPTPPDWCEAAHPRVWGAITGLWDHVVRSLGIGRDHLTRLIGGLFTAVADRLAATAGGLIALLVLLALLVAAARRFSRRLPDGLAGWWRSLFAWSRGASDRPRRAASETLLEVEGALAPFGVIRAPSATPGELLLMVERSLPSEAVSACRALVDRICRTLYRGDPWDAAAAGALMDELNALLARSR
jgi:hypothetical protein